MFLIGFIVGGWIVGGLVERKYCKYLSLKTDFNSPLACTMLVAIWPIVYLIFWLDEIIDKK